MDLDLHINMDNAAFEDGSGAEVARILRKLADGMRTDLLPGDAEPLYDVNGNQVGAVTVTK